MITTKMATNNQNEGTVVLVVNGVEHAITGPRVARMMALLAQYHDSIERRKMFQVEFSGRPEQVSMSFTLTNAYARTNDPVSCIHST